MSTCLTETQNQWKDILKRDGHFSTCLYTGRMQPLLKYNTNLNKTIEICRNLIKKQGVYSVAFMNSCGFKYTGIDDTARCDECELELNHWTSDINPYTIHATRKPNCPFIMNMTSHKMVTYPSPSPNLPNSLYSCPSPKAAGVRSSSISNEQEIPPKRLKIETNDNSYSSNSLFETRAIQEVRRRTFSHWSNRNIPSQSQMIEAGFYNCNVGDRVICIYCNLICQQWTLQDDPCEVHKILSPNCIYVKNKLIQPETRPILIVNETLMDTASGADASTSHSQDHFKCNEFVSAAACNRTYAEIPKRTMSFASWTSENMPSVDDLVRAGFFYTGTKSIVTCFYCNGSLQNWGANDNPMIEHARWFPHCAYAKQLCGADLYRKIQESKRAQQGMFNYRN